VLIGLSFKPETRAGLKRYTLQTMLCGKLERGTLTYVNEGDQEVATNALKYSSYDAGLAGAAGYPQVEGGLQGLDMASIDWP
jgi:hypothetical protein